MKNVTIALGVLLALAASPLKRQATCQEECLAACYVGPTGSHRQFVCEHECFAKCSSHRAEHKTENR